ncbi:MAG: hypothetical protein ACO1NX_00150 [Chitinophagaceae bacterium]
MENFDVLDERYMTKLERYDELSKLYAQLPASALDSATLNRQNLLMDTTVRLRLLEVDDTAQFLDTAFLVKRNKNLFAVRPEKASSDVEPNEEGKSWMEKTFDEKWERYRTSYGDDPNLMVRELSNSFIHKLPYLLFVSLPFFALFLKWVYWRQKHFYYSDHAVFTLYHYIFSFLVLLLFFAFHSLADWSGWSFFNTIGNLFLILWPLYLYLGMRRFYGQGWRTTFGKFVLVNLLGFISLVGLFILFILISIIQL